ncbi:Hypothetical protein A7982_04975 [Minicystis rosea]|nr:Hypothetical protein A7982_04975 [Minicystis rosea]
MSAFGVRVAGLGLALVLVFGGAVEARSETGPRVLVAQVPPEPPAMKPASDGERADVAPVSSAVRDAEQEAEVQRWKYEKFRYEHAQAQYEAQSRDSRIVFTVVIGLVLIGVYFAYVQFQRDMQRPDTGASSQPAPADKPSPVEPKDEAVGEKQEQAAQKTSTEGAKAVRGAASVASQVELGLSGLKVSSPVLGVLILTLSLGFFYLYLRYVYPVNNSQQPPSTVPSATAG